jgi:molybdopterin molybdotransferase
MTSPVAPPDLLTTVDDALTLLLARLQRLPAEEVRLSDCLGRVLAEDVVAVRSLPGCDNSAMDGYAVRAEDCSSAPRTLPLVGESRAGMPAALHRRGTAMRISTGAPIPLGADSVVRIEDTQGGGDDTVSLQVAATPGQNIRPAGADCAPGDVLVRGGRRLRAIDIAGLAAAGRSTAPVSRRPLVALVAGGDELVPAGTTPQPQQVTDSNTPMQ